MGIAEYPQAAKEGYELMQELDSQIEQLETQVNIIEGRLGPILLSPDPESEMAHPMPVAINGLQASIQRLSDRVTRLRRLGDRIRL